jgi:hypothetical protein
MSGLGAYQAPREWHGRESDPAKDFAEISQGAVGFGVCIWAKRNGFSKSLQ